MSRPETYRAPRRGSFDADYGVYSGHPLDPRTPDCDDEGDSSYCDCGAVHTLTEHDRNRCSCCGKDIE